jgi:hypothetical protein
VSLAEDKKRAIQILTEEEGESDLVRVLTDCTHAACDVCEGVVEMILDED